MSPVAEVAGSSGSPLQLIVVLLVMSAVALFAVAALPRTAVPAPSLVRLLSLRRFEIASSGTALLVAAAIVFLTSRF